MAVASQGDRGRETVVTELAAAVSLGVTAIGVVRGGAFFTPDLVAVPVVLALAALVDRRALSRTDLRLIVALAAFAALWLWRGVAAGTPGRAASLSGAAVAFAAAYATSRRCRSERQQLLALRVLVLVGVGVAVVSLFLWEAKAPPWGLPFDGVWRLSGPFAYPNAAGLFFALVFIANLAHNARTWRERALSALCVMPALIATASRGAFVALVVGLVVLGRNALRVSTVGRRVLVGLFSAAALAAAVYVALLTFGVVGDPAAHDTTASLEDRVAEWTAAARQGGAAPLLGQGPEQDLYIHNFRGEAVARYAHNEPLQVFAGLGVVGLAALGCVVVATVGALRASDGPRGRLAVAALGVLVVGGLLDFSWHFVGLTAYAGWLVGLDERPATE